MMTKRKIEIFSAGCSCCQDTIELVNKLACPSCEVTVLDMHDPEIAKRAKALGICAVPTVVVDGKIAECCNVGKGANETQLKAAGVGQPI